MKTQARHNAFRKALLTVAGVGLLLVQTGCSLIGVRTVEEAPYRVLKDFGDFEIRAYEPLVVVETTVDADYEEAGDLAFGKLFAYISGKNRSSTKIAMTAPVMADPDMGEKIAMTAPVMGAKGDKGWRFAFVLPAQYSIADAPLPLDADVRLTEVPAKKVVALRYSGRWSAANMRQKTDELLDWLAANNLEPASPPRSAGYDPPWTVPALRRNEVMIDIE